LQQQEQQPQGYVEELVEMQTVVTQEPAQVLPTVAMAIGERVLLWYNQEWLPGTLASFGEGCAFVKCDCDSDTGFSTKAPLSMIRTMTTEDQLAHRLPG